MPLIINTDIKPHIFQKHSIVFIARSEIIRSDNDVELLIPFEAVADVDAFLLAAVVWLDVE